MLASLAYWAAAILLILGSFLVASLFADRRRDQVVTDFINFVDQANGSGLPPHVVAHSLGWFVLGRVLFRYSEFRAGKVVLLGCVLKPELDWGGIRGQFQLIRNELGAKDWVSITLMSSASILLRKTYTASLQKRLALLNTMARSFFSLSMR